MDFREDKKKEKNKKRENLLKCFLLGGEKRERMVKPKCFLSEPTIKFSLQNGKKTR